MGENAVMTAYEPITETVVRNSTARAYYWSATL